MTKTGIIVVAHGSRGNAVKLDVEAALQSLSAGLRSLLTPDVEIFGAAMQFNHPTLAEAAALLAREKH